MLTAPSSPTVVPPMLMTVSCGTFTTEVHRRSLVVGNSDKLSSKEGPVGTNGVHSTQNNFIILKENTDLSPSSTLSTKLLAAFLKRTMCATILYILVLAYASGKHKSFLIDFPLDSLGVAFRRGREE